MQKIIFLFFILILILSTHLYSKSYENVVTSSTSFSQEIEKLSPSVETYTAEDIKLMGIENIPELLNFCSGVFVNRVNGATAEYYLRGFIPELRMNPLIFIDGMEITENFYNRSYLYNLPVTIDDIDRIEIIKDTTSFSNGYITPGGIINIVTKKPQYLDNNYISATSGSRELKNYNFSINKYLFSAYWKLTGNYRGVNDFSHNKRIDNMKMTNLSVEKYFNNSKLFIRGSLSENNITFFESYPVGIMHREVPIALNEQMDNLKMKNFLINYQYPHIDTSFYYQGFSGFVHIDFLDGTKTSKTVNEFYKYSFRYSYKNLLLGFEYRYFHVKVENLASGYSDIVSSFLEYEKDFLKNFQFKLTIRNDYCKDNGDTLNYKFNIGYISDDKSFRINAGYLKTVKPAPLFVRDAQWKTVIPYKSLNIPVTLHNNKNIHLTNLYTTDFNISKSFKDLSFKFTAFYNRITNSINQIAFINGTFFSPKLDIYSINLMDFVIHGFETNAEYKFNPHNKIFASYVLQQAKNKTMNATGNYFIPHYKITSGILFKNSLFYGSLITNYIPAIKVRIGGRSDYIFSTNIHIAKNLNKHFSISLYVNNLFNDVHKESYYGENIYRLVNLKLKYTF